MRRTMGEEVGPSKAAQPAGLLRSRRVAAVLVVAAVAGTGLYVLHQQHGAVTVFNGVFARVHAFVMEVGTCTCDATLRCTARAW